MKLIKSNRVNFTDPKTQEIAYGVVVKGGMDVQVVPDNYIGRLIYNSPDFFNLCDQPFPEYNRSEIDLEWSCKTEKIPHGDIRVSFFKNGVLVFINICNSRGSMIEIEYPTGQGKKDFDLFLNVVHDWIGVHTGMSILRGEEKFVTATVLALVSEWNSHFSWLGVTPADYLSSRMDEIQEMIDSVHAFNCENSMSD